jgi:rubrerythrin
MVKILVSQSLIEIESLKSRLEQAGISCMVKNQYTATLAGEVPFAEVFPELWVENERDVEQAKELLAQWRTGRETIGTVWVCRTCGEEHGSQFTHCWKCGAART